MADDFDMIAGLDVADDFEPGIAEAARLTVARHATDAGDCADLLTMLGLAEDKSRPRGCRECSGPLSLLTISGKCGLRDFCSYKCRDAATRAGR
ncbi:hypothetical protein ACFWPK_33175 [Nocardia sp. NPDC058519]|uniref:hypothetical protein n=1 Tax=Nocardia sp. NPDC058519 TaxID=3346535 RepID=UPI00365A5403